MISDLPYLQYIELIKESVPEKSWSEYPFSIPIINSMPRINFHDKVTFFVGENGSGKSTLIEAIAYGIGLSAEGGTKDYNIDTSKSISSLYKHLRFTKSFSKPKDYFFLRAESFYNIATFLDSAGYLPSFGGKRLHSQSHGESFMAIINNKLKGGGLYIFDEPESALSPQRQLSALVKIHELVKLKSQFIIATHSPILMAYPHAKIVSISSRGIKEVKYEETEHFQLYDLFFKNHKGLINQLLSN